MNRENMVRKLKRLVFDKYDTWANAAREWNISAAYASKVKTGQKAPTQAMLDDLGYKKEIIERYVKL